MTDKQQVAAVLHEFYDARNKLKAARSKLMAMAVACGQIQNDAMRNDNAATYLDGWLGGAGSLPADRRTA